MRFAGLLVLLIIATASAETLVLTDGSKVQGKLQKTGDGWNVTRDDGTVVSVSSDKVASIEAGASGDTSAAAMDRLQSLRNATVHMDDLAKIIQRYQQFIELNATADQSVLDEASKDLAVWHERQDKGLVKLGDNWITPEEREQRRQMAQGEALQARDLVARFQYDLAGPILKQALLDDPQDATALYVQGVMFYKQEQVGNARKDFEASNAIAANNAPTLNNLAVACWREHSYVAAVNYYMQAMIAAPWTREILDNVVEALNALPDQNKDAPVVHRAADVFNDQDQELQRRAALKDMYRWGSGWVSAKQLAELKAQEARINDQIDAINKQGNALLAQISTLDDEMNQNQMQMDRLQAAATVVDSRGNTIQLQMPQDYYNLQRDNENLAKKKADLQSQAKDLSDKIDKLKQSLPMPRFTGIQKIIGVEGSPVRVMPTTLPATLP